MGFIMNTLFGERIPPSCKYCALGCLTGGGKTVLCTKRGIKQPDEKCRHFSYDPLSRVPKRPKPLEKFDQEDFSL